MEESSSPTGMELALFQAYVTHTTPRLLDKTGVYVVQPNGLQNHLRGVFKVGKGQLWQRFRMYKQMWPDGGKVFAFFTVPTASASWAMQRDIAFAREQQLIGTSDGLLRHRKWHGEWVDASLREIITAMQRVHAPSEGHFYVCDAESIRTVQVQKPQGDAPARIPRKVLPFRRAKAESLLAHFRSLGAEEKRALVRQMPSADRQLLWESLSAEEQPSHLTTFALSELHLRWLPTLYSVAPR